MKQINNIKKNNKKKFLNIAVIFFGGFLGITSCLSAEKDKETPVSSSLQNAAIHQNKFSSFPQSVSKIPLKVAVFEEAPFAFRSRETGVWEGISVAVWERIARVNNLSFRYIPVTKKEGEKGVSEKKYDLMLGALPAFPEDGMQFEYTIPFYVAGMGFAVPDIESLKFLTFLNHFISWGFLKAIGGLLCFLLIGALLIHFFEHRQNPTFSNKGFWASLGNGFWWASATMTTVGYGDVVPKSLGGRIVGVVWMFTAILMISSLMGSVSSALTVGQLSTYIRDLKDLRNMRVVCVNETASKAYLSEHFIPCHSVRDLTEGIQLVEQNRAQAFVYSEPILRYMVLKNHQVGITILPAGVSNQYYSFILPVQSDLLHPLNQAILRIINSSELKEILYTYLGYVPEVH